MAVEFDRDEGAERNEVLREWEGLPEGEVGENLPGDAGQSEFLEEEEEGWEESEEFTEDDSPEEPGELPPLFSTEKSNQPQWRGDSAAELP
jgi:hypothetical protein